MKTYINALLLNLLLLPSFGVNAQAPLQIVAIEGFTVEFSNIRIVTAAKMNQDQSGSHPESPVPLDDKKMLAPGTLFFVAFDYKSNWTPSEEPQAVKQFHVGLSLGRDAEGKETGAKGFQGYGPCALKNAAGTGFIWLSGVLADSQKRVDVKTALVLYGVRNDKVMIPSVTSQQTISFVAKLDGLAQISETQFDAIKAMYKRIADLEARVKELESRARK